MESMQEIQSTSTESREQERCNFLPTAKKMFCFFQITELKINSNPFAKGFREDGMNSKK